MPVREKGRMDLEPAQPEMPVRSQMAQGRASHGPRVHKRAEHPQSRAKRGQTANQRTQRAVVHPEVRARGVHKKRTATYVHSIDTGRLTSLIDIPIFAFKILSDTLKGHEIRLRKMGTVGNIVRIQVIVIGEW